MPEIAPWENPHLPAPFAQVERSIKGRKRHFSLWQWDERIVWCEINHPRLWWATFDCATKLDDWALAVEEWRFGRAFTQKNLRRLKGENIGLAPSSRSEIKGNFYVVADQTQRGLFRQKEADAWIQIHPPDNSEVIHNLSIWRRDFSFNRMSKDLRLDEDVMKSFVPTVLNEIYPDVADLLKNGGKSESFLLMHDLARWVVNRGIPFDDFIDSFSWFYQKIIVHFGLPLSFFCQDRVELCYFSTHDYDKEGQRVFSFVCNMDRQHFRWSLTAEIPSTLTAHELLELQLRLRDALKPILTAAEIEEILAVPTRP